MQQPKTQSTWQGTLQFEEGSPTVIRIGKLNINSSLHFMSGKRIILLVEMLHEEDQDSDESATISTSGKLEYDEKKKVFLFEKYPFAQFLESFADQKIKLSIELDRSVMSSLM